MKGLIVAGIGTEVGKSVASAVLCEALGWSYWKPLASGLNDGPSESATVGALLSNSEGRVFPERYLFGASLSPHIAASMEGVTISLEELRLPESRSPIVVELAGGVMVPLNDAVTNLDLICHLNLPVVVVSRHYLGSINHTLLTLDVLRSRDIPIYGVLFNGEELPDTERIIERLSGVRVLGRIPSLPHVTRESVQQVAMSLRGRL
jgi:dethiobiotin synthetase